MPSAPRVLFAGLVDDAALFPPGNAPMPDAISDHLGRRRTPNADLVGAFVCPASRVDEMRTVLPDAATLDVSVVFDVAGDAAHQALRSIGADPRLTLSAVEAAAERLGDDAAQIGENLRRLPNTVGYLEAPRRGFDDALDLVAKGGWQAAKYRTGGVTPDAFPGPEELAAFVSSCVERDLPFKLTAGLHHAIRHDEAGMPQFGVLNVLAAVKAALDGQPAEALAAVLDDPQPHRTVDWSGVPEADCRELRRYFRSFGCCGVAEPIGELSELGLVEEMT